MNRIEIIKDENGQYVEREFVYAPLWWHEKGLSQTRSGYGSKLTTPYKVEYKGNMRRVYCVCYSNIGSLYVIIKGENVFLGV